MYYELNDSEYEKIREISSITFTDYDLKANLIPVDNLMAAIEDLLAEYHHKEEELEDLKQEIEDNYKPISYEEQIGYNPKDFL